MSIFAERGWDTAGVKKFVIFCEHHKCMIPYTGNYRSEKPIFCHILRIDSKWPKALTTKGLNALWANVAWFWWVCEFLQVFLKSGKLFSSPPPLPFKCWKSPLRISLKELLNFFVSGHICGRCQYCRLNIVDIL